MLFQRKILRHIRMGDTSTFGQCTPHLLVTDYADVFQSIVAVGDAVCHSNVAMENSRLRTAVGNDIFRCYEQNYQQQRGYATFHYQQHIVS